MTPSEHNHSDWRKSSYSGGQGNCVELASTSVACLVRDSKNPTGPMLAFPAITWRGLELGLLDGPKGSS